MTTEIFTTSGSWTRPDGVRSVYVEAWGAGGDGAASDGTLPGGGGGGGGFSAATLSIDSNVDVTVTVPTGGGGNASFGSALEAYGGQNAQGFNGGSGGYGGTGSTNRYGGAGAPYSGDDAGGGGGGAGSTENGGDADGHQGGSGGTSGGGNGGDGSWLVDPDYHGENGLAPGGGGGGGRAPDGQAGLGARGEVRVTYTPGYLAWTTQPASGVYYEDQVINTVAVTVRTADHATDTLARENVTLQKITGPGILTGTTVKTPVNGVASFDDLVITEGGWHQLRAYSTGAEGWPESGDSQSFEILVTQETIDAFGQSMAAQGSRGSASRLNELTALATVASSVFVAATPVVALQGASGTASGEEGEGARSPAMTGRSALASTARSEGEVIAISTVDADARLWTLHLAGGQPDLFAVHDLAASSMAACETAGEMTSQLRFEGGASAAARWSLTSARGLVPTAGRSSILLAVAAAPDATSEIAGLAWVGGGGGEEGEVRMTLTAQTVDSSGSLGAFLAVPQMAGQGPAAMVDASPGAVEAGLEARGLIASACATWLESPIALSGALPSSGTCAVMPPAITAELAAVSWCQTEQRTESLTRAICAGVAVGVAGDGGPSGSQARTQTWVWQVASGLGVVIVRDVARQDVRYCLTCQPVANYRLTCRPAARYLLALGDQG